MNIANPDETELLSRPHTFREIKSDIEKTLGQKHIGRVFTAAGVQVVSRENMVRLILNFSPAMPNSTSWVGKITLTELNCSASRVRVAQIPSPVLKCSYAIQETYSAFKNFQPHEVIGVFSNANEFITTVWNMNRLVNSAEQFGDETDWEDYHRLPNDSLEQLFSPKPNSWELYNEVAESRSRLQLSMASLLGLADEEDDAFEV